MDLLPYFERELVYLRELAREFCARYPSVGGKMGLDEDSCPDPQIARLIQSSALLTASIAKRLDDSYPDFTEALLEKLAPHFLRPFPSCSIVRIGYAANAALDAGALLVIPRGTELDSSAVEGVHCRFKTVYDVTLTPATLSAARFDALARPPAGVVLPRSATSTLSIAIEGIPAKLATLRVFIDGEPSLCAALRDALFMCAVGAYVEDEAGRWITLSKVPLKRVGFAEDEALIPFDGRAHAAYRFLSEYFVYPEKFNFFDIDLPPLRARLPPDCGRFKLHLALTGLRPDSHRASLLDSMTAANLVPGCSPVVNLFQRPGQPIAMTHRAANFGLLADATHPSAYEVYSVDKVNLIQQREHQTVLTEIRPLYSPRHSQVGADEGRYWILRNDETIAAVSPGHEKSISLIDGDFNPQPAETVSLSIALNCTNRDLPHLLREGEQDGQLTPPRGKDSYAVHLLRKPSRTYRWTSKSGLHWRLISHLSLHPHGLCQEGLPAFREMLALYDLPQSTISRRQIEGITGLESAETATWMRSKFGASLEHGTEIRLTIDEEAFVASGLQLFVDVIDRFFGLYAQVTSFIELVVLSQQTGKELIRCEPRRGHRALV